MEWTLATPFIDRPRITEFYLEALKRIDIPRKDIHLLFVDLSNNVEVTSQLEKFIEDHGGEFKSWKIIHSDLESFVDDIDENGVPDYYSRRIAIGETMNLVNSYRKGHLLLWEDDIIPAPDAFTKLHSVFGGDSVKAVTSVQYSRRSCWKYHMLMWNYSYETVFGNNDSSKEKAWKSVHIEEEKEYGVESIGASATGFIIIKDDFLKDYIFDGRDEGQDVQLGKDITGFNRDWKPTGNHLLVNWEVKTVHLGKDEQDRLTFYRSPKCNTIVYDKRGEKY